MSELADGCAELARALEDVVRLSVVASETTATDGATHEGLVDVARVATRALVRARRASADAGRGRGHVAEALMGPMLGGVERTAAMVGRVARDQGGSGWAPELSSAAARAQEAARRIGASRAHVGARS